MNKTLQTLYEEKIKIYEIIIDKLDGVLCSEFEKELDQIESLNKLIESSISNEFILNMRL